MFLTCFPNYLINTNKQISNYGTVAIAFDANKISVKGIATCGWKPSGTSKTITSSSENQIYELAGEPPLDLIMRYAGIKELPDSFNDTHTELNHTLQIQLQREKGDPIMRVGVANKDDKSFTFFGSMPEGEQVKFCLLPDLDVLEESVAAVESLKQNDIAEADAVLLFLCVGRLIAFGPEIIREIEGVKKVWNAPMAGFFSQGELGRATGGELEVHNLTTCCVALKEI
jgi:hypothetical protein